MGGIALEGGHQTGMLDIYPTVLRRSRTPVVSGCTYTFIMRVTCSCQANVLVATAEVVRRAFIDCGVLRAAEVPLIVFDEVHNAVGGSPMAAIAKDGIWPSVKAGMPAPRILGLTASFCNGSLKGIEKKRGQLEETMQEC